MSILILFFFSTVFSQSTLPDGTDKAPACYTLICQKGCYSVQQGDGICSCLCEEDISDYFSVGDGFSVGDNFSEYDEITMDGGCYSGLDCKTGEIVSTQNLGWLGNAWSTQTETKGVTFKCSAHNMFGALQKEGETTLDQSYSTLDYGLCCRPGAMVDIYEKGAHLKRIEATEVDYAKDMGIKITGDTITYTNGDTVLYTSSKKISSGEKLHFVANFGDEGAKLTDIVSLSAVAVDGGFSDWGACDATCGTGERTRLCDSPAATDGGADCDGDLFEECNIAACPINGGLSDNWSSCSVTCGTGTQTKSCDNPAPDHGGADCSGVTSQECNVNVCPERCVVNFHDTITNTNDCECGPNTETVCAKTEFCYATSKVDDEETCTTDKYGICTKGVDKNIFYGGKVMGNWLKKENQMKMYVETPFDVEIKSIVWQTASYTAVPDSTLEYSSDGASVSNQWTVAGGTNADPCKRIYDLTVSTATYFGDGSEFAMTHVDEKYCLQSSIKVTAEQKREFTPSGLTTPYKYTRKIVNTMPINVELQTTSTVDVVFKMIVSTKERNDFVLFVGGEEGLETGKHIVTIEMISFSPHGLKNIADGGVTISAGSDKIKANTSIFSQTANEDPENFDIELNMVKDMITWKFEPVVSYHDSSYTIRLNFHDKVTSDTWEADAEIHISKTDLMAEVGFQTDISLYADRQCETANTQFQTSQPIYAKLILSNQIVAIETIACTAFIVRQYSNSGVEGETAVLLVEKKMKEESDLFSFTEGDLKDADGVALANTWVCGADLDSAFFKVSSDGYPAELTVEVTVTYVTADGANKRRILSVPVVNPWVIENAEQLSPAQIEDVRRILAEEHGQIPEVAIGEAAQAQTEATQQNEPKMLKASFTITKGHKQGDRHIESGVAGMKTLGEDDSNIGMRMLIGAGFVCVGLSIYIRSRAKSGGEYTQLVE